MNLKVAVCDDEEMICDEVCKKIRELRPEYEINSFCSGDELLDSKQIYDIVFLDIEMPEKDGLIVAEELRKREQDEHIIFLTGHSEIMQEAFKVKAHRFLTKSDNDEAFLEALVSAETEIMNEKIICVKEKGKIYIKLTKISCVEAFGDGVYIYSAQGVFKSGKPLKYWQEELGTEQFYQVNRAVLVAYRYTFINKSGTISVDYKKEEIKISRRKRKEFENNYCKYLIRHVI